MFQSSNLIESCVYNSVFLIFASVNAKFRLNSCSVLFRITSALVLLDNIKRDLHNLPIRRTNDVFVSYTYLQNVSFYERRKACLRCGRNIVTLSYFHNFTHLAIFIYFPSVATAQSERESKCLILRYLLAAKLFVRALVPMDCPYYNT